MRRICLVGALLLAGCQGLVGPRQRAEMDLPVDPRNLPTDVQKQIVRDRWGMPDTSPAAGPQMWTEPPGAIRFGGRGPGQ
jgi:hypothetical protein